jgi:hypothetical protein
MEAEKDVSVRVPDPVKVRVAMLAGTIMDVI